MAHPALNCLYRKTHCRSRRNGFRKSRRSYLTKMVLLGLIAPFNTSVRKMSWVDFTFKRYTRDNLSVRLNRRNFIAIKSVCSGRKNQCYFFKCEISMYVHSIFWSTTLVTRFLNWKTNFDEMLINCNRYRFEYQL